MSDRIILAENTIKVSKPGYDVFTAGPKDLAFNINDIFKAHYSVYLPVSSINNNNWTTIPFPTLPYRPIVMCLIRTNLGEGHQFEQPLDSQSRGGSIYFEWDNSYVYLNAGLLPNVWPNTGVSVCVLANKGLY